jgi:acyl carrier protein
MTSEEARRVLLQAMRYANVQGLPSAQGEAFVAGEADIQLDRLDMDSLAAMELCIAIEANGGASITPDQLKAAATGSALVRLMLRPND